MWFVISAYTSLVINSCQVYFSPQIRQMLTSIPTNQLTDSLTDWLTNLLITNQQTNQLHVWVLGKLTGPQSSPYFIVPQCLLPHAQGCRYTKDYLILKPMKQLLSFHILLGLLLCRYWSDILLLHYVEWHSSLLLMPIFSCTFLQKLFCRGVFTFWLIVNNYIEENVKKISTAHQTHNTRCNLYHTCHLNDKHKLWLCTCDMSWLPNHHLMQGGGSKYKHKCSENSSIM